MPEAAFAAPVIADVAAEAAVPAAVAAADIGTTAAITLPEVTVEAAAPAAAGITGDLAAAAPIAGGLAAGGALTSIPAAAGDFAAGLGSDVASALPSSTSVTPGATASPMTIGASAMPGGGAGGGASGAPAALGALPDVGAGGAGGASDAANVVAATQGGAPISSTPSGSVGTISGAPASTNIVNDTTTATATGDFSPRPHGIANWLGKQFDKALENPLSLGGVAMMGVNMLMGDKAPPGLSELKNLASTTSQGALALESGALSGKLPGNLQAAVDLQTKAGEAAIRSRFASAGLSGSTMEGQALAGVRQQAAATAGQIATRLFQSGVDLSKLSASEWEAVLNAETAKDAAFNAALGRFAGGIAGARTSAAA